LLGPHSRPSTARPCSRPTARLPSRRAAILDLRYAGPTPLWCSHWIHPYHERVHLDIIAPSPGIEMSCCVSRSLSPLRQATFQ
jgi:hypothetical protein